MALYLRKPLIVDAVQFDPALLPWPEVVEPWKHRGVSIPRADGTQTWGYIRTETGYAEVMAGDWIVAYPDGKCYPISPDVFERTFEPVVKQAETERSQG